MQCAFVMSAGSHVLCPSRIMWIALIMVGALSSASAINMSLRLGSNQPEGARRAGYVGIAMAVVLLGVLSALILIHSDWFGRIFTNDIVFLRIVQRSKRALCDCPLLHESVRCLRANTILHGTDQGAGVLHGIHWEVSSHSKFQNRRMRGHNRFVFPFPH